LPVEVPQNHTYWSLLQSIRDSPPPSLPPDSTFSNDFRDFINKCLQTNPSERATCKELLKHRFLANAHIDDQSNNDLDHINGISEMQAIILAIYSHIQMLKKSKALIKNSIKLHSIQQRENETDFFGENIHTTPAITILQRILFGDSAPSSNPQRKNSSALRLSKLDDETQSLSFSSSSSLLAQGGEGGSSFNLKGGGGSTVNKLTRHHKHNRLFCLANQLHVPYDKFLSEVKIFFDNLSKTENCNERRRDGGE
jgi:serine/threonine protein kinase